MKIPVMKVGYILTTFPCRTETFAAREIEGLTKLSFIINVFAAANQGRAHPHTESMKVFYRPSLFSLEALLSIGYLCIKYPFALAKLLCLVLKVFATCRREAMSLISNIHTIGFFTKHLDEEDIFHIHAYFLSWPATIGLAISVATGRSFSISAHARDIFVEHGAIGLKVSHAKFLATCSQQGLEYLKANLPAKYHYKLRMCYHGIKISSEYSGLLGKCASKSNSNGTVIAVGRLVQKKGFEGLLRAFALVVRENPHYRLIIVGDGPGHKQLNDLIKQLTIKDQVELMGWQGHNVTLRLIKQATVLVAPSLLADDGDRDGIPNVIIEAFASGTPVIASGLEGISEVVEHCRTGLLVKPGNIAELASAIKELLNNKHLQNRLSQAAYETVIQRFDTSKNTRQLVELFLNAN